MENGVKICPHCGKETSATAKYCRNCGKFVGDVPAPAPDPQISQEPYTPAADMYNTGNAYAPDNTYNPQGGYNPEPAYQQNYGPAPQPEYPQYAYPQQGGGIGTGLKAVIIILILAIGAGVGFGAYKLFLEKKTPAPAATTNIQLPNMPETPTDIPQVEPN